MSKPMKVFCWVFIFLVVFVVLTTVLPSMLWITKLANETSAAQSLEKLGKVEELYRRNHPEQGFTCSLSELGEADAKSGPPDSVFVGSVNAEVGQKSGYSFTLTDCRTATVNGHAKVVGYKFYAVPQSLSHTGDKGFCSDERGKVMVDPKGGTDCTEPR